MVVHFDLEAYWSWSSEKELDDLVATKKGNGQMGSVRARVETNTVEEHSEEIDQRIGGS